MQFYLTQAFKKFFRGESFGGTIIIAATFFSLFLANSAYGVPYIHFWESPFFGENLEYWINDGLMVLFFLLVGTELKREFYFGELSNFRYALFPVFGAIGGMIFPYLAYSIFNFGGEYQSGYGIPMATDTAFALAILTLLGSRISNTAKVFLTSMAVVDDIGAILVIAIFYTGGIDLMWIALALACFIVMFVCNRAGIKNLIIYGILGIALWYCMLHTGIHATIAGILIAIALPIHQDESQSPSYRIEKLLHFTVPVAVLPVFVMANTAFVIPLESLGSVLTHPMSLGIIAALMIGKPTGIFLMPYIVARITRIRLPNGLEWKNIFSLGILGGIGFTMSIFITLLAFPNQVELINQAKLAIIISAVFSGIFGYICLHFTFKKPE